MGTLVTVHSVLFTISLALNLSVALKLITIFIFFLLILYPDNDPNSITFCSDLEESMTARTPMSAYLFLLNTVSSTCIPLFHVFCLSPVAKFSNTRINSRGDKEHPRYVPLSIEIVSVNFPFIKIFSCWFEYILFIQFQNSRSQFKFWSTFNKKGQLNCQTLSLHLKIRKLLSFFSCSQIWLHLL